MKKIITLLLSLAMVLSLVACGSGTSDTTPVSTSTETSVSVSTETSVSVEDTTSVSTPEVIDVDTAEATIGEQIYAAFTALVDAGKNGEEITTAIAEQFPDWGLTSEVREAGYIPGFSSDVTGFAHCYGANPWISTQPFACYIFQLDSTDEAVLNSYLEGLNAIADPRWNICTEAGEVIGRVYGGYVFFGMFPSEEEW